MTERSAHSAYKGDLPGSRSAPCLGCGERVVLARDAHVTFGGKRDGSLLTAWETEPQRSYATDVDRMFDEPDLYLLGVAHRDCGPVAKSRLEAQLVELPDELPQLLIDEEVGELPPMHLPPSGDLCAFCGAADASAEHVFPKWISRELGEFAPLEIRTEHGRRRVRTISHTAPVCSTCNNRWLSVLENDVRPILAPLIRGQERILSLEEQTRLATWAVKTALMLDLGGGRPIVPTGYYYELRQQRTALDHTVVFTGAYLGGRKAIWSEHRGLLIGGADANQPPNAFVTTFSVYRVIFQVVGHFTKSGPDFFSDNRDLAIGLTQIWPAQGGAASWPRDRLAFNDETLAELAASVTG